jgi:hypothetical protein
MNFHSKPASLTFTKNMHGCACHTASEGTSAEHITLPSPCCSTLSMRHHGRVSSKLTDAWTEVPARGRPRHAAPLNFARSSQRPCGCAAENAMHCYTIANSGAPQSNAPSCPSAAHCTASRAACMPSAGCSELVRAGRHAICSGNKLIVVYTAVSCADHIHTRLLQQCHTNLPMLIIWGLAMRCSCEIRVMTNPAASLSVWGV